MKYVSPSLVRSEQRANADSLFPFHKYGSEVVRQAARLIAEDRSIYAVVSAYALCTCIALLATGTASAFAFLAYIPTWPIVFFLLFPFVYAMLGLLQVVHRIDRRRRLAIMRVLTPERLASIVAGLVLLAATMVFQGAFTSLKNAFPIWADGFPYDRVQADIDEWMHLGRAPWLYLHDVAGTGIMRAVIEWNYNQGWFIVCFATMFWMAVAKEARPIRTRYFVCYVTSWVLIGSVFAGLFLSAGPAFYGYSTGDFGRFGALLTFLDGGTGGRHSASNVQMYLWSLHQAGSPGLGSGISAFPSMHVSLVTLNALFLFEHSRRLGMAAFVYVAFVLASSVYLAWHYAIDGYFSIVVTVCIFLVVRSLYSARERV